MLIGKSLKDSGNGNSSNQGSDKSSSSFGPRDGLSSVFSDYSEKCSLVGVSYIRGARSPTARTIWSLMLVVAIGVMFLHLQMLFTTFFSYGKNTKISLGFSSLDFPAVTFCNVNAMRMSKIKYASKGIQDLIKSASIDNMQKMAQTWSPSYEPKDNNNNNKTNNSSVSSQTKQMRSNNFFDSMPIDLDGSSPRADVKGFYEEQQPDSWQSQCEKSTFDAVQDTFKALWVAMPNTQRAELGHQIQDMLLQCSFAGGQCVMGNFTPRLSATYGNCYTIEYDKWKVLSSGPDQGLELILHLETDEYVSGITNEKGLQLVIHEQGTMAFPDDEGIAVAAGTQTVIGLRQVQVTRLGSPYGECRTPEDFLTEYTVKYTRQTCQKMCQEKRVRAECGCYDELAQQICYMMSSNVSLPPCRNETEMYCLTGIKYTLIKSSDLCNCNSPCLELQFEKTISSRQWPSEAFANVMVDMICQEKPGNSCQNLRDNKSQMDLSEEFIKLNIYFEDLNYEQLSEAPDYELTQFLSDVGGTIGLYIGLSVMGIFELFDLVFDIFNFIYRSRAKKVEQVKCS